MMYKHAGRLHYSRRCDYKTGTFGVYFGTFIFCDKNFYFHETIWCFQRYYNSKCKDASC